MKILLSVPVLLAIILVSGCTRTENGGLFVNGNDCKSDYIVGGPLQKFGENYNFETTCANMCREKYKIGSYRVDQKTESFSMCYCDINEC